LIKLSMSHYYRKFIEKSRSLFAHLSSSKRIDFSLLMVELRVRLMDVRPYRKLVASLSAYRDRPTAEAKPPPGARLPAAPKPSFVRPTARRKKTLHLSLPTLRKRLFNGGKPFSVSTDKVKRVPQRKERRFPEKKVRRPLERKPLLSRLLIRRPSPPVENEAKPAQDKPLRTRSRAGKRIDIFLFIATIVVLVIVSTSYFRRTMAYGPISVNIFISAQYWEMFGETADSFAREFEEQNPGFRILMADEETPDIVFFDDGEFAALVAAEALASLSSFIYTEAEEEQWELPLVSFVDLFFYNIDILQGAGNDRPPRTRAEFLDTARSVAETYAAMQGEVFPFALGLGEADPLGIRRDFYPWVWALGAEVHSGFAEDGSLMLTGPSANTINFLAEMNREGLLAPGTFEVTGRERLEQFAQGRIAMMIASARDMVFVRDNVPGVNFDITAVPAMALGRNRLGVSGIYAGISSDSTQPETAWAFLVFIAGRSHLLASAIGAVPGSYFMSFPNRYIGEDPMYSKAWDLFEAAEIVEFPSGDILEKEAGQVIREMLVRAFEEGE